MPERSKTTQPEPQKSESQTGTTPLPRLIEVGLQVFFALVGGAMILVPVMAEVMDTVRGERHAESIATLAGHLGWLIPGIILMLVAYRGLRRTVAFATGLAGAWRKRRD